MFDSNAIRSSAVRCNLAYYSASKHKNEQWRLDQVTSAGEPIEVVSIAGSNDVIDWLQNISLSQVQIPHSPEIRVSEGVFEAANNLIDVIDLDMDKTYMIEGHSAGGSKALAVGLILHYLGYSVHSVTTFAAPRITRTRFEYPFDVTQVEAFGDPVPFVPCWRPWRPLQFGWRHNGFRIRVGAATVANRTREFLLIRRMIRSHLMPNYLDILGA